jgi:hypothetical protein
MALPSQTARPIARRNNMYRRSRPKRRSRTWLVAAVLVLIVIVVVVVQFWPAAGSGQAAGAGQEPGLLARRGDTEGALNASQAVGPPSSPERSSSGAGLRPDPEQDRPSRGPGRDRPAAADAGRIEMGGQIPAAAVSPGAGEESSSAAAEAPAAPSRQDPAVAGGDATPPSTDAARRALSRAQAGLDLLARNEPVQARRLLSQALESDALSPADTRTVREALVELSDRLVFSPEVVEGDPFALNYTIQGGDALSLVPRKMGVQTDWRFIARINRIPDARRIRAGQRIKLITGPFHAVIHKRAFRLDLYLGDGAERVYVRSFPVGLGEYNSTPEGRFRVRPNSRLKNPEWVNPRTGQRYRSGDPDNPIGEHWIGLAADEERLAGVVGYGIHGTIEPDSIGRQSSMGCVRMLPEDIEVIWEVLLDPVSTVQIRP